jgi:general nucleoside transport system permease protein
MTSTVATGVAVWAVLRRLAVDAVPSAVLQLAAFAVATVVAVVGLAALGYSPATVVRALWRGAVAGPGALNVTFGHAVPFMLAALAVWLAYQGGLFNVGPDGQLQVGGLATLAVVTALPDTAPGVLLILAGLTAGTVAGAAWAAPAVILRTRRGANEIITTLMSTFIALQLVNAMISGPMRSETARFTPQTNRIPDSAILGSMPGTPVTIAVILAAMLSVAVVAVVQGTRGGLRLRAIGLNRRGADRAGVPVVAYQLTAFLFSGALAGLAGALVIVDLRFLIAPGWAPFWGFGGILIAFLVQGAPVLIPAWGVLFGMLAAAGPALKGSASVPDAVIILIQLLPVLTLFVLRTLTRRRRIASSRDHSHVPEAESPRPRAGPSPG